MQENLARASALVRAEVEAFAVGEMNEVKGVGQSGSTRTFDMAKWLEHGDFGRLLVEGFAGHYSMTAPDTMLSVYKHLSQFLTGLAGVSTLSADEITIDHVRSALEALGTPGSRRNCCGHLQACLRFMADRAPDVRRPYLFDEGVRERVRALAADIATHQQTLPSYAELRKRGFEGSSEGRGGRVLSFSDETIILAAAAEEIERSWQLHLRARELARTGTVHALGKFPSAASIADCIASIDAMYSGRPWPTLSKALFKTAEGRVWQRLHNLATHLGPEVLLIRDALHFTSAMALVPYVVALVWWSSWNTATMQALNVSGITGLPLDPYEESRTNQRVVMRSVKRRKGGKTDASNSVSFDSLRGVRIERARVLPPPAVLLQRIRSLTQRLRPHLLGQPEQDRLLIFGGQGRVHVFGGTPGGQPASDVVNRWRSVGSIGVVGSAERNLPLPDFSLRDVRMTVLKKYSERSLALGRDVGQHTAGTQRTFYLPETVYERSRERFAVAQSSLENLAESRGLAQSGRPDLMGAVPGFDCVDPFASPIPTEANGKRCAAMQCPVCSNARVHPDDGRSFLHLFRRREALLHELPNALPARRLAITKHFEGINDALAHFTPDAIDWARKHDRLIGRVLDLGGIL